MHYLSRRSLCKRIFISVILLAAFLFSALLFMPSQAHAEGNDSSLPVEYQRVLSEFEDNLTDPLDKQAFGELSSSQKGQLAGLLTGDIEPDTLLGTSKGSKSGLYVEQSFEDSVLISQRTAPNILPYAKIPIPVIDGPASSYKTVKGSSTFKFAGITITKTGMSVTYKSSRGLARSIVNQSCYVETNYQPWTSITTSKNGSWVQYGQAVAECKVHIKRGANTPVGGITWSEKSGIQYLVADGSGVRKASGWR